MRLKCWLLKSLLRADTRGQAIFELDNKEINRKTLGRFLMKTRGDNIKMCAKMKGDCK